MQHFVDQRHGVQLARVDGQLRMLRRITHQVHALRKLPAGGKVGENHVAGDREQLFGECVPVASIPGHVELKGWQKGSHAHW